MKFTDAILNRRKCCPTTEPLHLSWHVSEIHIPGFDGTRYIARKWNVQLVIECWNTADLKSGAEGPLSSGRAPEWKNADVVEFLAADEYQVDAVRSLCEDSSPMKEGGKHRPVRRFNLFQF